MKEKFSQFSHPNLLNIHNYNKICNDKLAAYQVRYKKKIKRIMTIILNIWSIQKKMKKMKPNFVEFLN